VGIFRTQLTIAVRIRRVQALRPEALVEEETQQVDRIGDVDRRIGIDIAANEIHRPSNRLDGLLQSRRVLGFDQELIAAEPFDPFRPGLFPTHPGLREVPVRDLPELEPGPEEDASFRGTFTRKVTANRPAGGIVSGTVLDGRSSRALSGATVRVLGRGRRSLTVFLSHPHAAAFCGSRALPGA